MPKGPSSLFICRPAVVETNRCMSGVGVFERVYQTALPHYTAVNHALLVLGTGASEHVQTKLDLGASEHV